MPRRFTSPSGYEVLVGLDAKENEKISLQIAAGHDYWFHAHQVPGSHVVMKVPKNQNIHKDDIEWAAGVAAWYSKARGDGRVRVTVARGTDISKSFPLGTVTCLSTETVTVLPVKK
jgi:predicted ribosome quality control (RQC) complex YloA/Tae2 family protein